MWNEYVRDQEQRQLGVHTHIDWARWDKGLVASLRLWVESSTVDTEVLALELGIRHGVAARMVEIDEAIPPAWHAVLRGELPLPPHEGWFATFAGDGKPLVIRQRSLIFVTMEQRLSDMHICLCSAGSVFVHFQPAFHWQPIRVVGSKGKRCTVDRVFPC